MNIDLILGIVGFLLTVMVFSYILGDNVFFRMAMYVLVGVSAGFSAAVLISKVIIPYLVVPLGQFGQPAFFLSLVLLLMSLMLLLMIFPRTAKAGRLPLAFVVGILAAAAVFGVSRGTIAPQLLAIINRFSPQLLQEGTQANWSGILEAVMMLMGVAAVFLYFHHRTQKVPGGEARSPLVEGLGSVGQIFIGITLGALFVGVYTSALLALISRLLWVKDFFAGLF